MGFLNGLAWLIFGGMGIKDSYDNKKYIEASKQRMEADDRLFYCDSKGRMFYKYTGEEIMLSHRNGRRVYINPHNSRVVCDLTAIQYKKQIDEWAQKYRYMRILPDGGQIRKDFDFKYRRFFEIKAEYDTVEAGKVVKFTKRYLKPEGEWHFVPDGPWFTIDEEEYLALGGSQEWVKKSQELKQALNATMTDTKTK